jgi:hypothetical protein
VKKINAAQNAVISIIIYIIVILFIVDNEPSAANVTSEQLSLIVPPLGYDIQWPYSNSYFFGAQHRWANFTRGTSWANYPPSTAHTMDPLINGIESEYSPGCSPTAMGQMMYYFLRDRYPDISNDIISINTHLRHGITVGYCYGHGNIKFHSMPAKRLKNKYEWDKMIPKLNIRVCHQLGKKAIMV